MQKGKMTWNPYKISPLHKKHEELKATYGIIQGWKMPLTYTEDRMNLQKSLPMMFDISYLKKINLKGKDLKKKLTEKIKTLDYKIGSVVQIKNENSEYIICCLTNEEAMIIFPEQHEKQIYKEINVLKSETECIHFTDVSSGLGGICIVGSEYKNILPKLTELNLNENTFLNLNCSQAPLAKTKTLFLRKDIDKPAIQIFFNREVSDYLWDQIIEASMSEKLTPIGLESAKMIGWRW